MSFSHMDAFRPDLAILSAGQCVVVNGNLVPTRDATASVLDRGLMYGDSIYTTLRVSSGRSLLVNRHLDRLRRDADTLRFGIDIEQLGVRDAIAKTIAANVIGEGYVRVQISRGKRISFPSLQATDPVVICLGKNSASVSAAISVIGVPDGRDTLKVAKTANRLVAILSVRDALLVGCEEAIFTDGRGVIEGTCHNIIGYDGGAFVTPDVHDRGLPGIVRSVLIERLGIKLGDISPATSGPLFATNCLVGVIPIARMDGQMSHPG